MIRRLALCSALLFSVACTVEAGGGEDEPAPSPDAAVEDNGGDNGGGEQSSALPFLAECDPNADLCDAEADLVCFSFNSKGPHCTKSCDGPEDCEAPSPGCNNMGVCKVP